MRYLSVCSGIEAATVAWHGLGWTPVGFSEIEAFPSAVLAHHYPTVPNFGDLTQHQEWTHDAVDLVVGGTPCQSFSVAGLRAGLADPRGNLALVFLGLVARTQPRWVVWENVPGVLSSNGGRDFGAFLGALAQLGYGWAYRVLDAQYFGVAQRRRRVFVVGYRGDWRRAAAVLFESPGVRRDSPPRRETREGVAGRVENSIRSRRQQWPVDIAPTLNAHFGSKQGLEDQHAFGGAGLFVPTVAGTLRMRRPGETGQATDADLVIPMISPALNTTNQSMHAPDTQVYIPMINVHAFDAKQNGVVQYGDIVGALDTQPHTNAVAVSLQGNMIGHAISGEPTTLIPQLGVHAFDARQNCGLQYGDIAGALDTHPRTNAVAIGLDEEQNAVTEGFGTLKARMDSGGFQGAVLVPTMAVRRLTPVECERLQGFPDGYTDVPYRNKPAADGPRYKALGNSMAVPVMRWLGQRIATVEAL